MLCSTFPEAATRYSAALETDTSTMKELSEAIERGDPDSAHACIAKMVGRATTTAGMSRAWLCPHRHRPDANLPRWFDTECKQQKRTLRPSRPLPGVTYNASSAAPAPPRPRPTPPLETLARLRTRSRRHLS
jgi:hypothetical protein